MSETNKEDPSFGPDNAVDSGFEQKDHDRSTSDEVMESFETVEESVDEADGEESESDNDSEDGFEIYTPSPSDDVYSPTTTEYDVPYAMFRETADTWRGGTGNCLRYDLFPETSDEVNEAVKDMQKEFSSINKQDVVEILVRVGMQHLDEAEQEAMRWGFQK